MNVETKYLRMIQGMKRRGRKEWTVYILCCGDGSLYTGIAKDVQARVKQHSEGREQPIPELVCPSSCYINKKA
jgi:hypothetical protein